MVKLSKNARAVLHTSMGEMTLELLPNKAPRTVENFVKLAHKGFYDGTTFHRVLKDFMVQGGCPKGDGTGGPGYTIGPEFNDTPHVRGTVSMARSNDPHSGGSQFFIVHGDARYLDNKYSAFARLIDGDEVLDRIAAVPVFENRWKELSQPRDPIYINRVELQGVEMEPGDLPEQGGQQGNQQQGRKDGGDRKQDGGAAEGNASDGGSGKGQGRADDPAADGDDAAEAEVEASGKGKKDGSGSGASGGKGASGKSGGSKGKASASGGKSGGAKKKTTRKKSGSRSRASRDD